MGFYRSKRIEAEVPRILHIEPYVKYEDEFIDDLAAGASTTGASPTSYGSSETAALGRLAVPMRSFC